MYNKLQKLLLEIKIMKGFKRNMYKEVAQLSNPEDLKIKGISGTNQIYRNMYKDFISPKKLKSTQTRMRIAKKYIQKRKK